ncbi:RNA polymerase sigma factor [Paractinoplanes brasiliensis]|uniref:RNA polymerase sigma factor (Sigma-70 family) n=1 Tax=Paractinoplanes brasiliensis TaxID=52695 RepID=A0A4R6JUN7_9ACTN|nr:sigma-70 family RNA polymerase sigma factor [Actinoplanes brasiliensis]TDO38365.1 RNA polymerase sigma factor (sigma-70 family) [Actinoplanes brasiliensis]GID26858.1 hypothetical protein Abr02nite_18410 [Actinoplanes brasiliensis]
MNAVEGSAALTPAPDGTEGPEADAERLAAQHKQEFEGFAKKSYHQAERVLRAGCSDRQTVEDALHDAYLHARVKWEKLRDYDKPIGWVIKTARNKILKEHTRSRREAATAPHELPATSTADVADSHGAQDALNRWLQRIPPRHAEVFQMTQEVFTDQQIADTLGIAERSVHHYRALALKRLRELAAADGFTTPCRSPREGGDRGPR